ncbi:hypothetical protein BRADI_2g26746v3 [Brachypodium distachyon]|uniref:Uncharacterized protein n=1 Tax=Brachypodium distachyon TaxID=15368 RepID=A0A2K2DAS0_BRADI|nr:hypothetical protein BRADI_2g26746v3 [Brachypodium distachyon]
MVGNPLICGAAAEQDCYGTLPMPMSHGLNNTQGKSKSHEAPIAFRCTTGCIDILLLFRGCYSGLLMEAHKRSTYSF